MMLNDMSRHISNWFDGSGPHADIVISSRIRLARNLAGYKFLPRLTPESQGEVLEKLREAILSLDLGEKVFFVDVAHASATQQELLAERHLISRRHANGKGARGVIIAVNEDFSAMINEEDQIRIQSF